MSRLRREPDATYARSLDVINKPAHDAHRSVVGHCELHLLIGPARDWREHGRKHRVARRTTQLEPLVIRIDGVIRQPDVEDHASFKVQTFIANVASRRSV